MGKDRPERDPRSPFEDEGIPDLQDGTPQQQWAEDPQQAPLPGEDGFAAAADYGTTANEQREGEGLARRLAREQPEETGDPADTDPSAGRLVAPEQDPAETAADVGPDGGGFSAEEDAVHIEPE
jgi:hypothetical protein